MAEPSRQLGSAGFSLIELSISLVVIGILLAAGVNLLSGQRRWQERQAVERQLGEIREALLAFAMVHGRLPRPAISTTDGDERGICPTDLACHGYLPWQTLGVNRQDAWGRLFRYSVSPSYAGGTVLGSEQNIALNSAGLNKDTASEAKVVYTLHRSDDTALERLAHAVPAVIWSQGEYGVASRDDGQAVAARSGAVDETANQQGNAEGGVAGTRYVARPLSDDNHPRGGFDDLVVWLPPHLLKARLAAAGRLP